MSSGPPCILFEDEDLLVVNKPPGWNTHSPAPYAGEGLYDWLRHREPRWAALAIIHRLDKETSGVIVFGKSAVGNRSLTQQFTDRTVSKRYLLLTDRPVATGPFIVRSHLVRAGERYVSRTGASGPEAATRFRFLSMQPGGQTLAEAEPLTGRTHQIRVHAAEQGFPILGDTLYGGTPWSRVCLHAAELQFQHPATGARLKSTAPADFEQEPSMALRMALLELKETNAFRLVHGAADGRPGLYLEQYGEFALSSSGAAAAAPDRLEGWIGNQPCRGVYHKQLSQRDMSAPRLLCGDPAPSEVIVRENGVQFGISFDEGYSVGLFLDQRDNRRRLLVNHIAAGFPVFAGPPAAAQVLNTFSYTCAFSVCAAKAGAHTTSLDLSKKYLQWGQRNFQLNQIPLAGHDFIYGDAFDWLKRLAKKKRLFDLVILDPPTFSRSKEHGTFQVEKDYPALVRLALPLLRKNGVLLASTNFAGIKAEAFLERLTEAIGNSGRTILKQHYAPQPPDFPITKGEPGYLKTFWMRLG